MQIYEESIEKQAELTTVTILAMKENQGLRNHLIIPHIPMNVINQGMVCVEGGKQKERNNQDDNNGDLECLSNINTDRLILYVGEYKLCSISLLCNLLNKIEYYTNIK